MMKERRKKKREELHNKIDTNAHKPTRQRVKIPKQDRKETSYTTKMMMSTLLKSKGDDH